MSEDINSVEQPPSRVRGVACLKDVFLAAFPNGTNPGKSIKSWNSDNFKKDFKVPAFPPDLFGLCGELLVRSGAYNIFVPGCRSLDDSPYTWFVSDAEMKIAREAGSKWKSVNVDSAFMQDSEDITKLVPEAVHIWWNVLIDSWHEQVYKHPYFDGSERPPKWWVPILLMLIAADEASEGIGRFTKNLENEVTWADVSIRESEAIDLQRSVEGNPIEDDKLIQFRPTYLTVAVLLNKDFACVQPKSKTPSVGCTLRSLSHNLSLLPHRGHIRTYWIRPPANGLGKPGRSGFNILMIPFPYHVKPGWFQEVDKGDSDHLTDRGNSWNWFRIHQGWLPPTQEGIDKFLEFVRALINKASEKGPIHTVLFPEYSLNWNIYSQLIVMIRKEYPSIEFLVSGSSDNCAGEKGNHVLSTCFFETIPTEKQPSEHSAMVTSRPKHHRWQINQGQVDAYGLGEKLDRNKVWWEHIPLPPRELHAMVFREGSVFSSLICEDLARSDPCHEILRSIGPNLLFVLLMDGPQLSYRWSARYSTGLSDDPGTSVLTITSRGLIKAANEVRVSNKKDDETIEDVTDWSIGLWKDDAGPPISIPCEEQFQASFVRLRVVKSPDTSFDGRTQDETLSWRKASIELTEPIDITDINNDLVEFFKISPDF